MLFSHFRLFVASTLLLVASLIGFSSPVIANEVGHGANESAAIVGSSIAINESWSLVERGKVLIEEEILVSDSIDPNTVDLITEIDDGWKTSVVYVGQPQVNEENQLGEENRGPLKLVDVGQVGHGENLPWQIAELDLTQKGKISIQLAEAEVDDTGDPLESVNRFMFGFNEYLQDYAFRPIAHAYNDYFPLMVRKAVGNFLTNLSSPVTLANDLLQLEFYRAWETLARVVVNTTAGIGGLGDVATEIGIEEHEEDFGQTLGSYGIGEGLYLVLPIFGPSSPRDVVGKFVVDPYFDLAGLWIDNNNHTEIGYARTGIGALDEYAGIVDELEQIKKTSVDFYAAVRSLYRQKREKEIANGSTLELPPIPDYDLNLSPEGVDDPVAGVH